MTDTTSKTVFTINPDKAKFIVNSRFYFNDNQKNSEFSLLPGHLQRAVNREAEFHVKTLSQTEGFSEILTADNFREAQKLHNAICEYIAHIGNIEQNINPYNPNNKFAALLRADKEAIYKENLDFGKTPYPAITDTNVFLHPTARRAKHFNESIASRKAKGVQRNAAETLQNIYNHIHAYGK